MLRRYVKILSAEEIANRVCELGNQITEYYVGKYPLVVVVVAHGGLVFAADLIRQIRGCLSVRLVVASSYRAPFVPVTKLIDGDPVSLDSSCLIIDEVLDSGRTLIAAQWLVEKELRIPPSRIASVVLCRKECRRLCEPTFFGFTTPNKWLVGYGMDVDGLLRNWPDINVVEDV